MPIIPLPKAAEQLGDLGRLPMHWKVLLGKTCCANEDGKTVYPATTYSGEWPIG